jgi:short-subunit dehydrogenase
MKTKVALVTGASSGIGNKIAFRLADAGYRVYGTSRSGKEIEGISMLPLEILNTSSIDELITNIKKREESIDVLVNNAGFDLYGSFEGTTREELHNQMQINFFGHVELTKKIIDLMKKNQSGNIINISSIGGKIALPMNAAYSASKFAMEGFFESVRYELKSYGIYVSSVQPQGVRTESLQTSIHKIRQEIPAMSTRLELLIEKMKHDGGKSSVTTAMVADTVLKILRKKTPKYRYSVGSLSRWISMLKIFLGQRLFENMIQRQFWLDAKEVK